MALFHGEWLSATVAANLKIDGPPGFYLASDPAAAEYFALRRARGLILEYQLAAVAVSRLLHVGAHIDLIPLGGFRSALPGLQFVVPPEAFAAFNDLRSSGEIQVRPYRQPRE